MIYKILAMILFTGSWCVIANGNANCCEEYCYDSDPHRAQYLHFGRLTSYATIRKAFNHQLYVAPSNKLFLIRFDELLIFSLKLDCKPEKIWLLVRHGPRQPRPQSLDGLAALQNVSASPLAQ